MPFPVLTFPNFNALQTYINTDWIPNGNQDITGEIGNNVENGLLTFIRQSPLNYAKAAIVSGGGVIVVAAPVTVFMTITPTSISWGDNIYNEFIFANMTSNDIPLTGSFVYYDLSGNPQTSIPANTSVDIFKAVNDLWVGVAISGTSTGRAQKQPQTYIVGTTPDAPTAGQTTWTLPAFENSWVVLVIARSVIVDMTDAGDGGPYITKSLGSDTLTIFNWGTGWNTGDILSYILITP